jgi:hypothetical protein
MKYQLAEHRNGILVAQQKAPSEWKELCTVLSSIDDDEVVTLHAGFPPPVKSLSKALNQILRARLSGLGWDCEPHIFKNAGSGRDYQGAAWRLDFAKNGLISVEVAFNHGEAVAWNLIKPCLASELNHVEKDQSTLLGVIITATAAFKAEGGFDSAVGTFEKFISYLAPLQNILPTPLIIVGLQPLDSYRLEVRPDRNNRKHGHIAKRD